MEKITSQLDDLAKRAKEGDEDAFGEIFNELSPTIYRFCNFRVRDEETAKDITSQVFFEAWQSLKRYNCERSFKTWIFSIARYRLIDYYRAYRPKVSLDDVTNLAHDTDMEAEIDLASEKGKVLEALDQLPETYQSVLKFKLVEELEYSEISDILGKTENNLRVIFKRGLDKLREILGDE